MQNTETLARGRTIVVEKEGIRDRIDKLNSLKKIRDCIKEEYEHFLLLYVDQLYVIDDILSVDIKDYNGILLKVVPLFSVALQKNIL